jgi:NADH dehydrogenase [ubiquinone] 1 alpha subcomplex assembly factor 7
MTSPLMPIIQQEIMQRGAITVADYMALALGHPEHGYYMRENPFGRKGDFVTAPEISQIFGELIGAWCAELWMQTGGGDLQLVELGPGRGTLMNDLLRSTTHVPSFHDSLCITMVETSQSLRAIQRDALTERHPRIYWQNTLDDLPHMPAIFIANEFFDALPIRQFIKTEGGLKEKMVTMDIDDPDKLVFTIQEMGLTLVKGGQYSDDGEVVETCPSARLIMQQICDHLRIFGGAGLVIDYGYTGQSRGNTLQAVRDHGFYPVLETPGKADITAHVDFDSLATIARDSGMRVFDIVPQGELLMRLGAELRAEVIMRNASPEQREEIFSGLERLVSPSHMGELFKSLSFTSYEAITLAGFPPLDDMDDYE